MLACCCSGRVPCLQGVGGLLSGEAVLTAVEKHMQQLVWAQPGLGPACTQADSLIIRSAAVCLCPCQVALDQLGFSPCFHARFMPYFSDFFDAMYEASEGRAPFPAREMFRRFNAAVDIPAPLIPLVLEAYPDAKVGAWINNPPRHQSWVFGGVLLDPAPACF